MRTLLFFLGMIVSTCAAAQDYQPVDMKKIKKAVTDKNASTYYPNLLNRLKEGDTTFTAEEFRLLYYGFVYQPEYAPYSPANTAEIRKAIEEEKFEKAIAMCDTTLSANPVSLKNYYYKLISLINLGRQDSVFLVTRNHYVGLLQAIKSSGDGETCKTGFKVITVSDEYEFMYRFLVIEETKSQSLQMPCDRITIIPSALFTKDEIFFDVSESLNAMSKMFGR